MNISTARRDARHHAWLAVAVILLPALWIFGRAIFTSETFAFRDAGHYYYPLFEWTSRQWAAGRVPLWNPHESLGVPVAAEATSSVFYPGKLLFALPLSYGIRYKLYVIDHLLMAACSAFAVARAWRRSVLGSAFAGLAFAFSGSVLFQYCNVVFLVGAAWLPLGLLAVDRMFRLNSIRWSLMLAMVLAMMVLGGDPQMAYHTGLLAILYAICQVRFRLRRGAVSAGRRTASARSALRLLTISAAVAALLSAVQILPSAQWSRYSRRAEFDQPRSIYEIPRFLAQSQTDHPWRQVGRGLFGKPERGSHHEHIYHFSVGPWHLAELVWPNASGRLFPEHHRWTNAIPAEGRTWTPSLYMGLLPLLFALASWRLRRSPTRNRWLTWTALLALLGSFGWYAAGWLSHEVVCGMFQVQPEDVPIGHAFGGVYWLMVVLLPGYAYFRYPAKLLVLFSLALSLLAARGFDRQTLRASHGLQRWLIGIVLLSLAGWTASFVFWKQWSGWLGTAEHDVFFGPLDAAGAMSDLRSALLHAAIVAAFAWLGLRCLKGRPAVLRAALLSLTAFELAIAQGWMAPMAPLDRMLDDAVYAKIISANQHAAGDGRFRIYRGSRNRWLPDSWSETASPDRLQQGMAWEVGTQYPKYILHRDLSTVESFGTFAPRDYSILLQAARKRGPRRPDGVAEPAPEILQALNVRYLILPDDMTWPSGKLVPLPSQAAAPAASRLWEDGKWRPRAWLATRIVLLPPLDRDDSSTLLQRTEQVLFSPDGERDPATTAVVEATRMELPPDSSPSRDDRCQIVLDTPQRVEVQVEIRQPRLLVLNDYFYPGWVARIQTEGRERLWTAPIFRTNRVMRGVVLPAGSHRVQFVYRPRWLYSSAIVSLLAWIVWLTVVFVLRRASARKSPSSACI